MLAQAFCLAPEIAGLQMCARFCLVYHSYCCGENFVLPLNILSPTHMHDHAAHRQGLAEEAEPACLKPRAGTQRLFREIDGSQRTVGGRERPAITGDAARRVGAGNPRRGKGRLAKGGAGEQEQSAFAASRAEFQLLQSRCEEQRIDTSWESCLQQRFCSLAATASSATRFHQTEPLLPVPLVSQNQQH